MSNYEYDDDDKTVGRDDDAISDLGSCDDPMSEINSDDEKTVRGDESPDTGFGSMESLATIGSILDDSINLDISRDGGISKSSTFDRSATVEDVIRSVERGYSDDYDLEYNGRVWPRDKQLRDLYIPKNGRVNIVEKKVKITVKNGSNGRKFSVDMPKSATVKALKNKLREFITIDNPRISFNGNELSDTKTLRDYNIQKSSELTIASRCYGG